MTKDQANEIKLWCGQLEQATEMGDEGARTRARNRIVALLDELTEPTSEAQTS